MDFLRYSTFMILKSFYLGAVTPWRALLLILRKPQLILLSLIPIGITFILYLVLFKYFDSGLKNLVQSLLTSWNVDPNGWITWGVIFFSRILFLLGWVFSFSFVSSLVACPFNDFLAEATEKYVTPPLSPVTSSGFRVRFRLIRIDLIKTFFAAGVNLFALFLSWVPVINTGALIVTFLLVTFQFISYPQTRRGHGVWDGIRFLSQNFFLCLGFGGMITGLLIIPVAGCFAIPLAVVGGTLLMGFASKT